MSDTAEEIPDNATDRPLVTFALFAYNQEQYIREAVEGAFSQTYEPLEIILSDDCSSDQTFEIMQEMAAKYDGPHQVKVRKNGANLGLAGHVNEVFFLSHGAILVLAAGDDISMPSRSEISVGIFQDFPNATAVLLSAEIINENSKTIDTKIISNKKDGEQILKLKDLLAWKHATLGATRAIRRNLIDKFPPLRKECPTEDTPLLLRSLICGDSILSSQKGIFYRKHNQNLGSPDSQKRMKISEIYHQYRDDICFAEKSQLVSKEDASMLHDWVNSDEVLREIKLKLASRTRLNIGDLVFVSQHGSFGFQQKFKTLVLGILGSWSQHISRIRSPNRHP
jgi:glycosyltransferase involved in cell wall biosynthesis